MKARTFSIALGILLSVLWIGATALADQSSVFESADSDGTLESPKLTVTIEGNQVRLSWNKVTGATDYYVHYAQYPYDNPDTIKAIDVGDKTSASYDLSPGSAYHVAVKACKDSGSDCSDYSNIHDVRIPLVSTFKNSLGQEFKLIPAGTFMMGSPSDEKGRSNNEIQHQVTLTQPFYMQTTEVTQGQWKKITGKNPSCFSSCGSDCPVECVSWNDVRVFIWKLNVAEETDKYRLPTEAEWEYACRSGSTTAFYNGRITEPNGDDPNLWKIGWYIGNSGDPGAIPPDGRPHPVAQKRANAWGLFDMSGNVGEWCHDWYGKYPSSAVTDPKGPSNGVGTVFRGGSWAVDPRWCRSACRQYYIPYLYNEDLGFRLARTP